jgi:hypothetical protein
MSGNFGEVITCVEALVKTMKDKRDSILRQLEGKQCVDTKVIALLLKSFVDQLLDGSDIKPEVDIMAHVPHDCHRNSGSNPSTDTDIELKTRIIQLEAKVEREVRDNQILHSRLQTFGAKESDYKKQIKDLTTRLEK